jgi:hypothetical protein
MPPETEKRNRLRHDSGKSAGSLVYNAVSSELSRVFREFHEIHRLSGLGLGSGSERPRTANPTGWAFIATRPKILCHCDGWSARDVLLVLYPLALVPIWVPQVPTLEPGIDHRNERNHAVNDLVLPVAGRARRSLPPGCPRSRLWDLGLTIAGNEPMRSKTGGASDHVAALKGHDFSRAVRAAKSIGL